MALFLCTFSSNDGMKLFCRRYWLLQLRNTTAYSPESLIAAGAEGAVHGKLDVRLTYMRRDAKHPFAGHYSPNDRFIRVAVNRNNRYPLAYQLYVSHYRQDPGNPERYWRGLRTIYLPDGESLLLVVFLHELSHYRDHQQGLNMNRKETRADQFSLRRLMQLQRQSGRTLLLRPENAQDRLWKPREQETIPFEPVQ